MSTLLPAADTATILKLRQALEDSRNLSSCYNILADHGLMERTSNGFKCIDPDAVRRRCEELLVTLTGCVKVPPVDTSPENLAYISALKPGERVQETGGSCMQGKRGVVYLNEEKQTCVRWDMGRREYMGTSVTWGTRRIADL